MAEIILPRTLSELAQIALDDVMRVRAMPGYAIDLGTWSRNQGKECAVCAAGSVMVCRLGWTRGTIEQTGELKRFGEENFRALLMIDALRRGCIGAAIEIRDSVNPESVWQEADFDPSADGHPLSRLMNDYFDTEADFDGLVEDMRELIADLREAGL